MSIGRRVRGNPLSMQISVNATTNSNFLRLGFTGASLASVSAIVLFVFSDPIKSRLEKLFSFLVSGAKPKMSLLSLSFFHFIVVLRHIDNRTYRRFCSSLFVGSGLGSKAIATRISSDTQRIWNRSIARGYIDCNPISNNHGNQVWPYLH